MKDLLVNIGITLKFFGLMGYCGWFLCFLRLKHTFIMKLMRCLIVYGKSYLKESKS